MLHCYKKKQATVLWLPAGKYHHYFIFSLTDPFKRSGWNSLYTGLDSISVLTDIGCKNGFFSNDGF